MIGVKINPFTSSKLNHKDLTSSSNWFRSNLSSRDERKQPTYSNENWTLDVFPIEKMAIFQLLLVYARGFFGGDFFLLIQFTSSGHPRVLIEVLLLGGSSQLVSG